MDIAKPRLNDLLILGGGPAGMSAALVAGRCRLRAVIVNEEMPRNRVTTASHGFLTRDGSHPHELLRIAKQQLEKYSSVRYLNDRVSAVSHLPTGFEARLGGGGTVRAKRIVLATGYSDNLALLRLPGIEEVYGKSVYPCLFCDGFEHRDERIALFGGDGVEHYAPLTKMWTDDLVVFTNGQPLAPEIAADLQRNGVGVREERVEHLRSLDGVLRGVELVGGECVERDCGFLWDDPGSPSNAFAEQLGVARTSTEWGGTTLSEGDNGKTNVDGVYVVGDARTGFSGLMSAANEGGVCVEHIAHEISQQRWTSAPGVDG